MLIRLRSWLDCVVRISLLVIVGVTFSLQPASAQQVITLQEKFEQVYPDSSYHLHPWVVPNSITVTTEGDTLSSDVWRFKPMTGNWRWTPLIPTSDPLQDVVISFDVRPVGLQRTYARRTLSTIDASSVRGDSLTAPQQVIKRSLTEEALFGDVDLQRSGSLSRGVTVGTNQDLTLESGLRFDLNGRIAEEVEIIASLTDQSTPIQPDGSTQNLREFDKVYMQLKAPSTMVEMGDVDVSLDESEFARINRRLQGVSGSYQLNQGQAKAAFSVARGQFRIQRFNGQDGVQGPYRLTGGQGEEFIIVLAGTERVYINGERVQRGEQNEYIIDYGLGEVHFTNNQLIREETRIVIEFEYLNRNYTRTLAAAEVQEDSLLDGRLSIGATVIREADNDNLANQAYLGQEEADLLATVGDQLDQAVVSGADSVGYRPDADFVLYSRVDTTFDGQTMTIFKNIPGDSTSVYRVQFSDVGEGNGGYQRVGRSVNGLVFEWVGPGQGRYEPFRKLVPPQKRQMVAIRGAYQLTDHWEVFGEWAGSDYDQNRLSSLDDQNNQDLGYWGGIRLQEAQTDLGTISAEISQRYQGKRFSYFERVRDVEFDRKWNITSSQETQERITQADAEWSWSPQSSLGISAGIIGRDSLDGNRQQLKLKTSESGWPSISYRLERVESSDRYMDQEGNWIRQQGLSQYLWKTKAGTWIPQFQWEQEHRKQTYLPTDTLTNESIRFYDIGPGLNWRSENERWQLGAQYSYRQDDRILNEHFRPYSDGWEQRYSFSYDRGSQFQTNNEVALRNKDYRAVFEQQQQETDSKGVFIRSQTSGEALQGLLYGQVLYDVSTQRRALLQETYIEVGPEIGQYVWEDTNEDGIQQIDEFFPELSPNEGTFVKQYVPSDELFPIIDLRTRFQHRIIPARLWDARKSDGIKRFLANTQWSGTIEVRESSTTDALSDVYLLRLNTFRNDSTTLEGRFFWRQELRLFTQVPKWDVRMVASQSEGVQQRTAGGESSELDRYELYSSYRLNRRLVVEQRSSYSQNQRSSTSFDSRNFNIKEWSVEPGIDLMFSRNLQNSVSLAYQNRTDSSSPDGAQVDLWKVTADTRSYLFQKVQLMGRVEWRNVSLQGASSTLGRFELTDGAGEGNQWRWSLQANYRVNTLIRASLNYDGRTIEGRPPIQTLRMVVSAVF
ncbi:MAG: hypothetical protein ACQETE_16145 [Bacteroidota bacterium]